MPFALAFFGILLIIAAVRGTEQEVLSQVADDAKHFIVWLVLLVAVGLIGLSEKWKPLSDAFLTLIVVAFVIRSGNEMIKGFNQLTSESKS